MRLTICSHKGGVGKSTTAVMLAALLAQDGPTVLIDGDRQSATASTWWRVAEKNGETWPDTLSLEQWSDPLTLPPRDLSHVVIDTGPGDPQRVRAAAAVCDIAVVVTSPMTLDAWQIGTTLDDIEQAGAPLVGVLLCQVHNGTIEAKLVPGELREDGIPALDTVVPWSLTRYARAGGTVPTRFSLGAYVDVLAELSAPAEV